MSKHKIVCVEAHDRMYCSFPFNQSVLKKLHARLEPESLDKSEDLGWQAEEKIYVFLLKDWSTVEACLAEGFGGAQFCDFQFHSSLTVLGENVALRYMEE